jgi:phage shock protein A
VFAGAHADSSTLWGFPLGHWMSEIMVWSAARAASGEEQMMFDRLKRLLGAAANKGMDKLETPEILAEKAQNELESALKELQNGVAESLMKEKQLEKHLKEAAQQLETWQKRAAVSVQCNNDAVARECLVKKTEATQLNQQLTEQLAQQKAATADLKRKYQETAETLREFQAKKTRMLASARSSDAVSSVQDLLSKPASGSEQWEEKIRAKEAMAAANSQLAQEDSQKASSPQSSIEDELAALKQQQQQQSPETRIVEDQ